MKQRSAKVGGESMPWVPRPGLWPSVGQDSIVAVLPSVGQDSFVAVLPSVGQDSIVAVM